MFRQYFLKETLLRFRNPNCARIPLGLKKTLNYSGSSISGCPTDNVFISQIAKHWHEVADVMASHNYS